MSRACARIPARARSRLSVLSSLLLLGSALPAGLTGQATFAITGEVVDASNGSPISLAAVELIGHGATLTADDGSFRFDAVQPDAYDLRIVAYGYQPILRAISLDSDQRIVVALDPAPIVLDPLVTRYETVDVTIRVRDPVADYLLVGADVLTNQGRAGRTDAHGRVRVRDVLEGVPLAVSVRAFGYLPADLVVLPDDGETYRIDLEADPVIEAMIDLQVKQLQERAAPRFSPPFRNLDREELLRYTGSHTLFSIIEFRYWHYLDRIVAVIIDGRRTSIPFDPFGGLTHVLPEEVERLEFISAGRRQTVVVVYTRDFMRRLIARSHPPS